MTDSGATSGHRLTFDVEDLADPAFSVTLNRRIVFWNAAAERFFARSPAEVIGRYCYDVMALRPAQRRDRCAACCMATICVLRGASIPSAEVVISQPDGRTALTGLQTFIAHSASGEVQVVHVLSTQRPVRFLSALSPREGNATGIPDTPPVVLTPREQEVLRLLADGCSTTDIAAQLSISRITARNHVTHLMDKLEAKTRLRAVMVAAQRGLL